MTSLYHRLSPVSMPRVWYIIFLHSIQHKPFHGQHDGQDLSHYQYQAWAVKHAMKHWQVDGMVNALFLLGVAIIGELILVSRLPRGMRLDVTDVGSTVLPQVRPNKMHQTDNITYSAQSCTLIQIHSVTATIR